MKGYEKLKKPALRLFQPSTSQVYFHLRIFLTGNTE